MTRRIAFLDIDGTILDHSGNIPESSARAIRTARHNGHLVYLASGRGPTEVEQRLVDLGFDGAVLGAGAYTWIGQLWHDGGWHAQHLMEAAQVGEMVQAFARVGADYVLQGRDTVWSTQAGYNRLAAGLEAEGRLSAATKEALLDRVTIVTDPPHEGVAKAVFSSDDLGTYAAVRRHLGERFAVITGTMPGLGTAGGEVMAAGVTKGSALLEVLGELGLEVSASLAIGDNNNDLEMLAMAGVGIAMGGATPEARAAADEVTTDVSDDGIWNAFAAHGLV